MNNKILIVGILGLLLFVTASAIPYRYSSNPTYENGSSIDWKEAKSPPTIKTISKEDWNKVFADYRAGAISKEESILKLKNVRRDVGNYK